MICLQETKLQDAHVAASEAATGLAGWHHHWHCSTAVKGYSGTAIITRFPPPPGASQCTATPTSRHRLRALQDK